MFVCAPRIYVLTTYSIRTYAYALAFVLESVFVATSQSCHVYTSYAVNAMQDVNEAVRPDREDRRPFTMQDPAERPKAHRSTPSMVRIFRKLEPRPLQRYDRSQKSCRRPNIPLTIVFEVAKHHTDRVVFTESIAFCLPRYESYK